MKRTFYLLKPDRLTLGKTLGIGDAVGIDVFVAAAFEKTFVLLRAG
jgi:hypothetical protein